MGLRGLPGQLISGDSGWLGTAEVSWSFWQKDSNTFQIVPFFGVGGVQSNLAGVSFSDTVGSGGVLARWLNGNHWMVELGWVEQFQVDDNPGPWTDGSWARASTPSSSTGSDHSPSKRTFRLSCPGPMAVDCSTRAAVFPSGVPSTVVPAGGSITRLKPQGPLTVLMVRSL